MVHKWNDAFFFVLVASFGVYFFVQGYITRQGTTRGKRVALILNVLLVVMALIFYFVPHAPEITEGLLTLAQGVFICITLVTAGIAYATYRTNRQQPTSDEPTDVDTF